MAAWELTANTTFAPPPPEGLAVRDGQGCNQAILPCKLPLVTNPSKKFDVFSKVKIVLSVRLT